MRGLRFAAGASLLGLLAGCGEPPPPAIDRIEIRVSGWSAIDIGVDRNGTGSFHLSHPIPNGKNGAFSVTAQQFRKLSERLEPYRRQSVPATRESALEFIERGCPEGVAFVTDAGGVYVHWIGPRLDRHFLADLGCDHQRLARRNEDLMAIVHSLPVPPDR